MGSAETPQVLMEEAEFCLVMGAAFIRYLMRVAKPKQDEGRAAALKIHSEEYGSA